ncbi:MAG: hypothetical protein MI717_05630 [Spirochaetales bacterium]|nr:hypothetical protein [Spirochaetales bacterium]
MKTRKFRWLIELMLFVFFTASLSAVIGDSTPLSELGASDQATVDTLTVLLDRANRSTWASYGPFTAERILLNRASGMIEQIENDEAREYMLARYNYILGHIELLDENKKESRELLAMAMECAEKSLEYRETAEAWRVRADAGSLWMVSKGLGAIIRTAPMVQEWSVRAMEMDPQNAQAIVINAHGLINAPRSMGGRPEEGLQLLVELNKRDDLNEIERFRTLVALSMAHQKLRNKEEARRFCNLAQEIFPENPVLEICP